MSVDLKGQPVDFDEIKAISKKYKIPLISDSVVSSFLELNIKINLSANKHLFILLVFLLIRT